MTDQYAEGYPAGDPDDLDPGPDVVESLEDADRDAERQDHVSPQGRSPEGSIADEDARIDAHDIEALDDTQQRDHLGSGRGRRDRPNFNDNTADWSRER